MKAGTSKAFAAGVGAAKAGLSRSAGPWLAGSPKRAAFLRGYASAATPARVTRDGHPPAVAVAVFCEGERVRVSEHIGAFRFMAFGQPYGFKTLDRARAKIEAMPRFTRWEA